jgi:hypothetical protein
VLRITRQSDNGSIRLKLEGKLLLAWTGEVIAQLPPEPSDFARLRLDLSAVHYLDDAGELLIRRLIADGAVIESASSFVSAVLNTGKA